MNLPNVVACVGSYLLPPGWQAFTKHLPTHPSTMYLSYVHVHGLEIPRSSMIVILQMLPVGWIGLAASLVNRESLQSSSSTALDSMFLESIERCKHGVLYAGDFVTSTRDDQNINPKVGARYQPHGDSPTFWYGSRAYQNDYRIWFVDTLIQQSKT